MTAFKIIIGIIGILPLIMGIVFAVMIIRKKICDNFCIRIKIKDRALDKYEKKAFDCEELEMERALQNEILGNHSVAIAILDKLLRRDSNTYSALVRRAFCLEALNYNLDAIDDFERALLIDNTDPNVVGCLGLAYNKIGDFDNGLKYLKMSSEMENAPLKYKIAYQSKLTANSVGLAKLKEMSKVPKNLLRRDPENFIDDYSEVDQRIFEKAMKEGIKKYN